VWINTAAEETDRGKVIGLYVAAMSAAYCVGYPLLLVIGTEGDLPFMLVAAMILAAGLPIVLARRLVPVLPPAGHGGTLDAVRREPIVMAASLVAGFAIAVVLSFLAIYAQRLGLVGRTALLVLATTAVGNLLLQVPIGILADRMGAERLLILVAAVGLSGLVGMPFLQPMGLMRWPFLFVWGGCLGGFYTLSLTLVGQRFRGDQLAGANAAFVVVYEVGGLLGAVSGGIGLEAWNPHGVLVALGVVYALFIAGCLTARTLRPRATLSPL
jgi:predicted MFS family arabinose efflux permease